MDVLDDRDLDVFTHDINIITLHPHLSSTPGGEGCRSAAPPPSSPAIISSSSASSSISDSCSISSDPPARPEFPLSSRSGPTGGLRFI